MRAKKFAPVCAVAVLTVVGVFTALPAGAAGSRTVKCHGTADFCGATVSLGGGPNTRKETIELTDTDFGSKPVAVRSIPAVPSGSYLISKPKFEAGGSLYVFTLKTTKDEPSSARLILLFAAGARQPIPS